MFGNLPLQPMLAVVEDLWQDNDKFKQRAAAVSIFSVGE